MKKFLRLIREDITRLSQMSEEEIHQDISEMNAWVEEQPTFAPKVQLIIVLRYVCGFRVKRIAALLASNEEIGTGLGACTKNSFA
ncbi:hypothetical protein [Dyadobacter pollutisoli]|uniref:Uncharacterized protein n=1 Tax=Dyadobacter pollutisoli TaxID=2910158 RepID=A0A9E8SNJ8_9BACT|nr:hypothetical protein [Dyadobacter pollutisoli]WAC15333.1 hypothetical protein ON006_15470 [Dyadobacter pollutisoli]